MAKQNGGRMAAVVVFGMAMVGLLGAPTPSEAQSARLDRQVERAISHERKAFEQVNSKYRWEQAAWNFRRAANLRPVGDPAGVESMAMAGRLSYYMDDHTQSVRDLERAGDRALNGGDVVTAATLLADAAWVAAHGGLNDSSVRLADRARILATGPSFTEERRGEVLSRLSDAGMEIPAPTRIAGR